MDIIHIYLLYIIYNNIESYKVDICGYYPPLSTLYYIYNKMEYKVDNCGYYPQLSTVYYSILLQ